MPTDNLDISNYVVITKNIINVCVVHYCCETITKFLDSKYFLFRCISIPNNSSLLHNSYRLLWN